MHAYKTAREERRRASEEHQIRACSGSSPKKREKLARILQTNNKETGRGTEISEKKRDMALS